MIYLQFLLGFIIYSLQATLTYTNIYKDSSWYIPAGVGMGIITSVVWWSISSAELSSTELAVKALIWDAMLMIIYVAVPILFFEAKLSTLQTIGFILTGAGLIMAKVG